MTSLLDLVLRHFKYSDSPIGLDVDNVDRGYSALSKLLNRRKLNDYIGMAKDRDKSLIWFKKRKK